MLTENIVLKPLKAEGILVPNKKAVVDTTTNRILGIVSPRYKIVRNQDLLKAVQPLAEELGMKTAPQIISTKGGAVTFFKFLGEKKLNQEVRKGDIVNFGIEFFNSYNGSLPLGFHITALRLVCTNGLVVPSSIRELSIRHMGDASASLIKNELGDYFGKTKDAIGIWKRWSEVRPSLNQVKSFLKISTGKKLQNNLTERYTKLPEVDQSLWGLYNVLTAYLTHDLKTRKEDMRSFRQFRLGERFTNRMSNFFEKGNIIDVKPHKN